jgi:23S rRNA (uracil1939-C5)-methyltransferase
VNSAAAACLYKLAGDWAAPESDTVLLDLYCGCGSFGVTLANRASHVIGIDSNAASVRAAEAMAAAHGIGNCKFLAGQVEAELARVLKQPLVAGAAHIVAIVDPPRGGRRFQSLPCSAYCVCHL